MEQINNLRDKRVCDRSLDGKEIIIADKGYITRITANPDGTLKIEQFQPKAA